MSIVVIKNGKEIGSMFAFSYTLGGSGEMYCKDTCLILGNTLNLNDEFKIKHTNIGEEKVYNCKIVFLSEIRNFEKFLYCENIECIFSEQTKTEEDHTGQIYNPYNDLWSWL